MKYMLILIFILSIIILPEPNLHAQVGISGRAVQSAEKLSLDIKGMDVLDVFRLLSMRGGMNIIAGKNVSGKVTLFLKSVDIWDAFEMIIKANGLAYEERNNIIYVMTERDYELIYGRQYEDRRIIKTVKLNHVTAAEVAKAISQIKTTIGKVIADEISDTVILMDIPEVVVKMEQVIHGLDMPLTTKVYSLQYAKAVELEGKLAEMLTGNIGSLRIDERTNKIAVTDLKSKIPMFDKIVAAFDEKHKEVIIEARILQVTLNDDYSTGINWDAVFTKMQSKLHNIATLGVSLKYGDQQSVIPTTSSTGRGGALQVGNLATEGYQAVIQALREYGHTNLLSAPRIVALNNEEASILVGTNQPYATRTISQGSGGTGNIEAENVTFIDLGIKLLVTPKINDEDFITMKIKPEVSSKIGDYTITSGNAIPIVKTTTAETTVMVKSGSTILIGGLIEESTRESVREVPGLANIPLIGNLFRSRTIGSGDSTNPEKTELVIFLTPHIITGEDTDRIITVKDVAQNIELDISAEQQALEQQAIYSGSMFIEEPELVMPINTDHMAADEYYELIASAVNEELEKRKPAIPVYGEVFVSFEIDRDGNLVSEPRVVKGDNASLSKLGIESVIGAAPFYAFPKSIRKNTETLQIAISYE
jgi:type II secretory pathway component GspD/PulD (secretin)